ncbi:TRAP transporter small permease [Enterovirga rhinocerotis]|uniref:TRAP transporter small permease protein n=1 Tax=Enterovirga rhinocerotis TaxID=1339210 RepID=A0A4R7BJY6_9HYPH|nr:TRAP transporter small permease [Enterovirga rhinocerotis]TDR84515.1 TRAP-type C4-dicarboxylate transport system permease small subunit [Enterovirga rhinocerotis]
MFGFIARAIDRLTAWVAAILCASLVVAVVVMLACIVLQVVMRYVVGKTLSWSEELAVLMFAWATLGGLALGVREGFHVRLDLLIGNLPDGARGWAERAVELLTASFGAFLLWSGTRFYDMTGGSVSAAIGYPIEFLHVLAPIAGGMICLFAIQRLIAGSADEDVPELAA